MPWRLREICDRHGILLIFDEVICGFGRTGKAFAAQSFDVAPDIMTMAKGLTNAAIPMGPSPSVDDIYQTVMNATPGAAVEFFHGYTYSGHPVACAAGLAALDIYRDEGLFERAARLSSPSSISCFRCAICRSSPTSAATACSARSISRPPRNPASAAIR